MKVIKATKPTMTDMDSYIKEIESIWVTGIMTNNGEKARKFKKILQNYLGYENIDLFVNGHSSLLAAMKALNLKGKVITSPFTFISTTNAIIQSGLEPVFADIDETYNLNPDAIENLLTDETSAIITPHIFGTPCDVERIENIAEKYKLKVIYDGAQAFGTKYKEKPLCCFGDITMYSFHAIKIFNSIEGGMLAYRDVNLHRFFELFRNFGVSYGEETNDVLVSGMNAKMNEFQAAMGIVNLPEIDKEIAQRKKLAEEYCKALNQIEGIRTLEYKDDISYNYAYFPIKITEEFGISRDELWRRLKEQGIESRKLYDKLTYDYACYKECCFIKEAPNAERLKLITLDLPLYSSLTSEDVFRICDTIRKLRQG